MRALVAGIAAGSALLIPAACGSRDEPATTAESRNAAGSGAVVCPNVRSNAAAMKISNRLDTELIYKAGSISCAEWSERGNPSRYSGRAIGEAGAAGKEYYSDPVWGLQPAASAEPVFSVSLAAGGGKQPVADFQVKVRMATGGKGVSPSQVFVRPLAGGTWTDSITITTKSFGKAVRIRASGTVPNPNDGSWDSPNGAQNSRRAWLLVASYVR